MRILLLTNMYPPHHYGGYEQVCRDVVTRFRQAGHEVHVLTSTWRVPGVADAPEDGVHRELSFYWDDHRLVSPRRLERLRIERHNHRVLDRMVATVRPDVVSVWQMGAMSLGLLTDLGKRGLPMVFVIADDWLIYGPRLDAWSRMFAQRRALGRMVETVTRTPALLPDVGRLGTFCFVSETTCRRAQTASGFTFPDAAVTPHGIDRTDFPPLPSPPPDREWTGNLLYVGRIDERKGIGTIVDALALLPGETLTVLGRGDDDHLRQLRAHAAEIGVLDRITFDVVDRHELAARYAASDAVVFPSIWDEPFGLVPLEAMACGVPVVGTGVGGSGEFMADGVNCLLFPPRDANALRDAVCRLAADPALRRRLVAGGLRTADTLTAEALADDLERWHLAAVDGFRSGRPPQRALRADPSPRSPAPARHATD
jgi:glycogen(starch) synthase